jgi:hypothetical protein
VELALTAPPIADGLDGELRGVMSGADIDGTAIGLEVIDSVRDGHTEGFGAEVMVFDRGGLGTPATARVLKATHQLLLFGINADDRLSFSGKALALLSNMAKLLITLWSARPGKIFAVAAQGDAQLMKQTTNGIGTDAEAQLGQSRCDMT